MLRKYANQARIDGHFNDVVIKAGKECFPANKLILSCFLSFFEEILLIELKEQYQETIQIKNFGGKAFILHIFWKISFLSRFFPIHWEGGGGGNCPRSFYCM